MTNDVAIWRIYRAEDTPAPTWMLCAEEREFAKRFHNPLHAHRWVYFRAALRDILSQYCHTTALGFSFRVTAYGKPALDGRTGVHFNQSHSHDLSLVCVSTLGPVGIDVERRRNLDDMESVARQVFSPAELAAFIDCPSMHRKRIFYDIWSRKEAVLKANGRGLSLAPDTVDVGNRHGPEWELITLSQEHASEVMYPVHRLHPDPAFAAALALEVSRGSRFAPPDIRYFDYQPSLGIARHPEGCHSEQSETVIAL